MDSSTKWKYRKIALVNELPTFGCTIHAVCVYHRQIFPPRGQNTGNILPLLLHSGAGALVVSLPLRQAAAVLYVHPVQRRSEMVERLHAHRLSGRKGVLNINRSGLRLAGEEDETWWEHPSSYDYFCSYLWNSASKALLFCVFAVTIMQQSLALLLNIFCQMFRIICCCTDWYWMWQSRAN